MKYLAYLKNEKEPIECDDYFINSDMDLIFLSEEYEPFFEVTIGALWWKQKTRAYYKSTRNIYATQSKNLIKIVRKEK
jgi:hypothetical protein